MNHSKHSSTKNWLNSLFLTLSTTARQQLTLSFMGKTVLLAVLYLIFSAIVNQLAIFINIFTQSYDFYIRIKVAFLMLVSIFNHPSLSTSALMITIALLVGANILLVVKKLSFVKAQKNIQWTFGAGILTLASSGCPACGFSILSLTGLTGAISGMPRFGIELSFLTLGLLLATFVYNLYSLGKVSCTIIR